MNQPSSTTSKNTNEIQYIGIDVCKARLDIHGIEGLDHVANSPEGHKKILQKLKPKLHQIALEATGGYEDRFIFQLHSKAIKVSRIEASRVRDYAKSMRMSWRMEAWCRTSRDAPTGHKIINFISTYLQPRW